MEQITRDGVSLAFKDAGKGAPPLLLIHDLGFDHTSLQRQYEYFRRRHRVVAVDLPGHGQSDPAPRPYTPADFAEDVAWLCYELGVYRPVAVGHGLGGVIAIELAAGFPDLLAAVVAQDTPFLRTSEGDLAGTGPWANNGTTNRAEARYGAGTTNSGNRSRRALERGTYPITTPENAIIWNGADLLARCTVPALIVEIDVPSAEVDRLRKLSPHARVEYFRAARQGDPVAQVNAAIDAFLVST